MIPNFRKKQKTRPQSNWVLFLLGAVVMGFIIFFIVSANIKIFQKKQELTAQLENLRQKIEEIKKSNQVLQANINGANDNNYVEKIAREQLGLQKENEKTTVFLNPEDEKNRADAELVKKTGFLLNLWQKMVNIFK